MGANRRYPGHDIDRAVEAVVVRPEPIGLTDAELDLANAEVREAARPVPVRAWVRFHEAVIQPECEAIAWTDKAVRIRWVEHGGAEKTAWVWASAVTRREP